MPKASARRSVKAQRDIVWNMRVTKTVADIIDRAAEIEGKSRTDFVLEYAQKHAIDALLDQRLFILDDQQHKEFIKALERAEREPPNEYLKKLFRQKSPWEK